MVNRLFAYMEKGLRSLSSAREKWQREQVLRSHFCSVENPRSMDLDGFFFLLVMPERKKHPAALLCRDKGDPPSGLRTVNRSGNFRMTSVQPNIHYRSEFLADCVTLIPVSVTHQPPLASSQAQKRTSAVLIHNLCNLRAS